jgi:hypothetical protein
MAMEVAQESENFITELVGPDQSRFDYDNYIRAQSDKELIDHALNVKKNDTLSFAAVCAYAAEIVRRAAHRLPGGRDKEDKEGVGRRAYLKAWAQKVDISPQRLKIYANVYKEFFCGRDLQLLARERGLPREYYVIALKAKDKLAAIQKAIEMREQGITSRAAFKEYVDINSEESDGAQVPEEKVWLRAPISREASRALRNFSRRQKRSYGEILTEVLLSLPLQVTCDD